MKLITTIAFLFLITSVTAQESIMGKWNTGQDNTQIEIKAIGNEHEGTIISSDNPNAPIGKLIIKEVIKVGDKYEGKLYAVKRK